MKTECKKERLEKMLGEMTETELKEMCFDSFIDGLEKGLKIQKVKNDIPEEETA